MDSLTVYRLLLTMENRAIEPPMPKGEVALDALAGDDISATILHAAQLGNQYLPENSSLTVVSFIIQSTMILLVSEINPLAYLRSGNALSTTFFNWICNGSEISMATRSVYRSA